MSEGEPDGAAQVADLILVLIINSPMLLFWEEKRQKPLDKGLLDCVDLEWKSALKKKKKDLLSPSW